MARATLCYGDVVEIGSRRFVMRPMPKATGAANPAADIRRAAVEAAAVATATHEDTAKAAPPQATQADPSAVMPRPAAAQPEPSPVPAKPDLPAIDVGAVQRTHKALKWQIRTLEQHNRDLASQLRDLRQIVDRLTTATDAGAAATEKLGQYVREAGQEVLGGQKQIRLQLEEITEDRAALRRERDELQQKGKLLQAQEVSWNRKVGEHRTALETYRQRLIDAAKGLRTRMRQTRRDRQRQKQGWQVLRFQAGRLDTEKADLRKQRAEMDDQRRELWRLREELGQWERRERQELSKARLNLADLRQQLKVQEAELAVTLSEIRRREMALAERQQTVAVAERATREMTETLAAQRRAYVGQAAQVASGQRLLAISQLRLQQQHHELHDKLQRQFAAWQAELSDHLAHLRDERRGLEEARQRLVQFGQRLTEAVDTVGPEQLATLEAFARAVEEASQRIAQQHALIDSELTRAQQAAEKVAAAVANLEGLGPSSLQLHSGIQQLVAELGPLREELEAHRGQLAAAAGMDVEPDVLKGPSRIDAARPHGSEAPRAAETVDDFDLVEFLVNQNRVDRGAFRRVQQLRRPSPLPLGALAQLAGFLTVRDVQRITRAQQTEPRLFGQLAVQLGLLTPAQLKHLLKLQCRDGQSSVRLLVNHGLISENEVQEARQMLLRRPTGLTSRVTEAA